MEAAGDSPVRTKMFLSLMCPVAYTESEGMAELIWEKTYGGCAGDGMEIMAVNKSYQLQILYGNDSVTIGLRRRNHP
ncbi:MAG: hypothetical protein ACLUIQ_06455 [Dialister invisus]